MIQNQPANVLQETIAWAANKAILGGAGVFFSGKPRGRDRMTNLSQIGGYVLGSYLTGKAPKAAMDYFGHQPAKGDGFFHNIAKLSEQGGLFSSVTPMGAFVMRRIGNMVDGSDDPNNTAGNVALEVMFEGVRQVGGEVGARFLGFAAQGLSKSWKLNGSSGGGRYEPPAYRPGNLI